MFNTKFNTMIAYTNDSIHQSTLTCSIYRRRSRFSALASRDDDAAPLLASPVAVAAGMDVVACPSASEANCDTRFTVLFLITAMIAAKCSALWHRFVLTRHGVIVIVN